MSAPATRWEDVYATQTARITELERELADWRYLAIWGGTPEVIHEFIRGQQNRIYHCQDLETELAALRSLLREAITEHVSEYDLPESADYIARAKTALGEGKP